MRKSTPWTTRFWAKVKDTGDCWEWTACRDRNGYGAFTGSTLGTNAVHRISYQLLVGPIPQGLVLDHLCRNTVCVNPAHLEPVTYRENSRRSKLILKDACKNGHPYEPGSYYMYRGWRECKECKIQAVNRYTDRTGRSKGWFICEFCGANLNVTGRSKHIKAVHPENYTPRQPSLGNTPERKARQLQKQRERRRAKAKANGGW